MNAAIALCSFCEMHGPKIIFTTQTFKNNDDQNLDKLKFYGPKEIFTQNSSSQGEIQQDCGGCHSLGDLKYLSNEHETRTSFLSAQQSLMIDIDNLLRHACIRYKIKFIIYYFIYKIKNDMILFSQESKL